MIEKRTPSLEQRIASALSGDIKTSAAISDLIGEVETAAIVAEQQAVEARAKALDPAITVDAAAVSAAVVACELTRDRLTSARLRLLDKLSLCLAAEAAADWEAEFNRLEPLFEAVVERLAAYGPMANELVAIFTEVQKVEQECDRLNLDARAGESRRLRFSTDAKRVLATTVLPAYDDKHATIWPIQRNGSIATTMFESNNAFLPPSDNVDAYTGDWWRAGHTKKLEQLAEQEQQAAQAEIDKEEFYRGR
jgi:hypothetical protein